MNISHLQSLIAMNANAITNLHYEVMGYKASARGLKSQGHSVDCFYKFADTATKRIAKLAALQRSLKKELFHTLLDEAFLKTLTYGDDTYMDVGRDYE